MHLPARIALDACLVRHDRLARMVEQSERRSVGGIGKVIAMREDGLEKQRFQCI